MLRVLGNLSISVKAFFASALLLISIAGLGGDAFIFLDRLSADLNSLSDVSLPKQKALMEVTRRATDMHVNVFRYVAWSSNGVNRATMDMLARDIAGHASAVERGLAAFAARDDVSEAERSAVRDAAAKWARFVAAAFDTLEIGSTDTALGSLMLGGTDDDYGKVAADLQRISSLVMAQTRSAADELAARARTNKDLIALGGVSAVLLGLGVTFLVARSLVRPIQSVTKAMRAISLGESDVDLGSSERADEIGQMVNAIAVFRDKVEQDNRLLAARERELMTQNMRFNAALNNMSQGLAMFDRNRELIVCNAQYAQLYGIPAHLMQSGASHAQILEHLATIGTYNGPDPGNYVRIRMEAAANGQDDDYSIELHDGRVVAVAHRTMPDGGWVSTHEDVTERRRAESRIAHMAGHDALTDLPNRMLFRDEMERALARTRRGEGLAVLFVDLDHFKEVNDTLGHPAGDDLLRAVAGRLKNCVRDIDMIARLGGDEFAVIRPGVARPEEVIAVAERIVNVLGEPYSVDGHEVIVGASVGIARAPGDGTSADQLLKNADMALYRAKADGRRTYRFFEPEMDARLQARRRLEVDLRAALLQGEFELYYQPVVNVARRQVSGFEALIRWNHPQRGVVLPAEFIPLAEEIGLIQAIGEWVLRQACAEAASWPDDIRIAINLSAAQFKTRNLVQTVVHALAASGLPAGRLELEVTESILLHDSETILSTLHQLHELGVRISMDDFGTGYSSLSYLRSFPFDTIKIDRTFVEELPERSDCAAIVRAVAGLGDSLGMLTTAEGVETEDQLARLQAEGCEEVQGYLFSRPVPAKALPGLIPSLNAQLAA
ncbi:MAG: EAL domain-containing protein [Xanthobacteraceae bacterium]